MRPVGRPGLTENGCSNSEGGVGRACVTIQEAVSHTPRVTSASALQRPLSAGRIDEPRLSHTIQLIRLSQVSQRARLVGMLQHGEHGLPPWSGRTYPTHLEEKQGFSAWLPEQRGNRATASTRWRISKESNHHPVQETSASLPSAANQLAKTCPRAAHQEDNLPHASQAPTAVGGRCPAFLPWDKEAWVPSGLQGLGAYAPTMSRYISLGFCARGGSKT